MSDGTRERSSRRKEIEKKKAVDGLIKAAASSVIDPLHSFPEFRHYNRNGLCLRLETGDGGKLSRPLKQFIQKLLKLNMAEHFGAEWHIEEKIKFSAMVSPEARYIFVYEIPTMSVRDKGSMVANEPKGNVVGFVQYRFVLEEELPVLYVYELQLEPLVQGKGLGKFLMELLEHIAHKSSMAAIMLTVQKKNLAAMLFYTCKLKFSVSSISPSRVDPLIGAEKNYEILCKALVEEAKCKLE